MSDNLELDAAMDRLKDALLEMPTEQLADVFGLVLHTVADRLEMDIIEVLFTELEIQMEAKAIVDQLMGKLLTEI